MPVEISDERLANTPAAYEIAMCSGCFGEYEGAEGFERSAAASEQGIVEGANNGERSVWRRALLHGSGRKRNSPFPKP